MRSSYANSYKYKNWRVKTMRIHIIGKCGILYRLMDFDNFNNFIQVDVEQLYNAFSKNPTAFVGLNVSRNSSGGVSVRSLDGTLSRYEIDFSNPKDYRYTLINKIRDSKDNVIGYTIVRSDGKTARVRKTSYDWKGYIKKYLTNAKISKGEIVYLGTEPESITLGSCKREDSAKDLATSIKDPAVEITTKEALQWLDKCGVDYKIKTLYTGMNDVGEEIAITIVSIFNLNSKINGQRCQFIRVPDYRLFNIFVLAAATEEVKRQFAEVTVMSVGHLPIICPDDIADEENNKKKAELFGKNADEYRIKVSDSSIQNHVKFQLNILEMLGDRASNYEDFGWSNMTDDFTSVNIDSLTTHLNADYLQGGSIVVGCVEAYTLDNRLKRTHCRLVGDTASELTAGEIEEADLVVRVIRERFWGTIVKELKILEGAATRNDATKESIISSGNSSSCTMCALKTQIIGDKIKLQDYQIPFIDLFISVKELTMHEFCTETRAARNVTIRAREVKEIRKSINLYSTVAKNIDLEFGFSTVSKISDSFTFSKPDIRQQEITNVSVKMYPIIDSRIINCTEFNDGIIELMKASLQSQAILRDERIETGKDDFKHHNVPCVMDEYFASEIDGFLIFGRPPKDCGKLINVKLNAPMIMCGKIESFLDSEAMQVSVDNAELCIVSNSVSSFLGKTSIDGLNKLRFCHARKVYCDFGWNREQLVGYTDAQVISGEAIRLVSVELRGMIIVGCFNNCIIDIEAIRLSMVRAAACFGRMRHIFDKQIIPFGQTYIIKAEDITDEMIQNDTLSVYTANMTIDGTVKIGSHIERLGRYFMNKASTSDRYNGEIVDLSEASSLKLFGKNALSNTKQESINLANCESITEIISTEYGEDSQSPRLGDNYSVKTVALPRYIEKLNTMDLFTGYLSTLVLPKTLKEITYANKIIQAVNSTASKSEQIATRVLYERGCDAVNVIKKEYPHITTIGYDTYDEALVAAGLGVESSIQHEIVKLKAVGFANKVGIDQLLEGDSKIHLKENVRRIMSLKNEVFDTTTPMVGPQIKNSLSVFTYATIAAGYSGTKFSPTEEYKARIVAYTKWVNSFETNVALRDKIANCDLRLGSPDGKLNLGNRTTIISGDEFNTVFNRTEFIGTINFNLGEPNQYRVAVLKCTIALNESYKIIMGVKLSLNNISKEQVYKYAAGEIPVDKSELLFATVQNDSQQERVACRGVSDICNPYYIYNMFGPEWQKEWCGRVNNLAECGTYIRRGMLPDNLDQSSLMFGGELSKVVMVGDIYIVNTRGIARSKDVNSTNNRLKYCELLHKSVKVPDHVQFIARESLFNCSFMWDLELPLLTKRRTKKNYRVAADIMNPGTFIGMETEERFEEKDSTARTHIPEITFIREIGTYNQLSEEYRKIIDDAVLCKGVAEGIMKTLSYTEIDPSVSELEAIKKYLVYGIKQYIAQGGEISRIIEFLSFDSDMVLDMVLDMLQKLLIKYAVTGSDTAIDTGERTERETRLQLKMSENSSMLFFVWRIRGRMFFDMVESNEYNTMPDKCSRRGIEISNDIIRIFSQIWKSVIQEVKNSMS